MAASLTQAEQMVAELNTLRAKGSRLETAMRMIRLGAVIGVEKKPRGLRRLAWSSRGYGASSSRYEALPQGTTNEFYEFLLMQSHEVGVEIRELTARLDALAPDKPVC